MYAYLLEVDAYIGPQDPWVMSSGFWDDDADWLDSGFWIDGPDTSGGVETMRLATHTIVTRPTDTPANTLYDGRIVEAGSFSRSLVSGGRLGRSSASWGSIELANTDGALDAWLDYGLDGRAFTVMVLPVKGTPVSQAITLFRGTIAALESGNAADTLRLRIRDRLAELQVPLLTTRYAGTAIGAGLGVEGDTDLQDQLKPRVFGAPANIQPKVVNKYDLLYQVSVGAVSSIAVYDGGAALTNAGDYPVLSSMMAATVAPGAFVTCYDQGIFRLGGTPVLAVTADVIEDAIDLSAAAVTGRILGLLGVADIDQGSFDDLAASSPARVGLFVDAETTALELISQVLASTGAAITPDAEGLLQVIGLPAPEDVTPDPGVSWIMSGGAWDDGEGWGDAGVWHDEPLTDPSVGELTLRDLAEGGALSFGVGPDDAGVPAWSVVLNYGRVWQTMTEGQLAGVVNEDIVRKTYLASQWRQATAEDASIKTKHILASQISADTLLTVQSDAQAEAARLLSLYGERRDMLSFPTDTDRAPYDLGQVVTVNIPRFGYDAGRLMLVVGKHIDADKATTTLDLWG
jgi:hypothetical protein